MGKISYIWQKYGSAILFGVGLVGNTVADIYAVWQTPKALSLLDEAERAKWTECIDNKTTYTGLSNWEKIKAGYKPYIVPAIIKVASDGCLIASKVKDGGTIAGLGDALTVAREGMTLLESKVAENVSPQKLADIKSSISEEKVAKDAPILASEKFIPEETGYGEALFKDDFSGRYFKCNAEKIRCAINECNEILNKGCTGYGRYNTDLPINELYERIGLSGIPMGETTGFRSPADGGDLIELSMDTTTMLDGMTPVSIIAFNIRQI